MKYIVMDLEWNGGYSRFTHGYFNEIFKSARYAWRSP